MTARLALLLAAVFLFAAVALGAFGAHARQSEDRAGHDGGLPDGGAVPFLARARAAGVGILLAQRPDSGALGVAGWLLVAGMLLFSGSLYALALTGVRGFGAITPVGGAALLGGWACLAWAAWRG